MGLHDWTGKCRDGTNSLGGTGQGSANARGPTGRGPGRRSSHRGPGPTPLPSGAQQRWRNWRLCLPASQQRACPPGGGHCMVGRWVAGNQVTAKTEGVPLTGLLWGNPRGAAVHTHTRCGAADGRGAGAGTSEGGRAGAGGCVTGGGGTWLGGGCRAGSHGCCESQR